MAALRGRSHVHSSQYAMGSSNELAEKACTRQYILLGSHHHDLRDCTNCARRVAALRTTRQLLVVFMERYRVIHWYVIS